MKVKRALIVLAWGLLLWTGYEVYVAGRNEIAPPGPQPITMHSGKAHGERLSTPSWSIEYDSVVGNTDQTVLSLQGIHHGIFYRNGKPYLSMRADRMTVNTISHDFTASGPLHIETIDHKHFRALDTTSATWNDGTKHLFLPVETHITTNVRKKFLIADSITVDVGKSSIHMEHVRGGVAP